MNEYKLIFKQSVWKDIKTIWDFIIKIAYIEDVKYVTKLIRGAINELKNPFLSGYFPYSNEIADKWFLQYIILGWSYIVFFKEDRRKKIRTIYYVKSARTDYKI